MISDEALMAYLDGQADADRVREIEAALPRNPALRARLETLEAGDARIRQAFGTLLAAQAPDHLEDFVRSARARPDNVIAMPAGRTPVRGAASGWRALPPWVGIAAAVQVALIVLAGIVIQQTATRAPPNAIYATLGAKPATNAANALVVFRPETPERELRAALRAADARIVGGPTSADAYLLSLPGAARTTALSQLRARADVTLAEPLDAPGAPR